MGYLNEVVIFGNSLFRWALALVAFLAIVLSTNFIKRFVARRLSTFAGQSKNKVDDTVYLLIADTKNLIFVAFGLYAASVILALPKGWLEFLQKAVTILLILQGGIWASRLLLTFLSHRLQSKDDPSSATASGLLQFVTRLVVWATVTLLLLDNIGIDVTALVAGLGVGGIAVALAVQNILGDLLASLSIVLDKPFEVGDFIIVGSEMGAVEKIGIKTTRVRSLSGEQLIIANSDLLSSRIRNYKRLQDRRIVFTFGVTYQTPHEKLVALPGVIKEIVESRPSTRFDRTHFSKFAASSLDFEVVYYVLSPDYNLYMDIQQAINLEMVSKFAELGIDFAYPTQSIILEDKTASL